MPQNYWHSAFARGLHSSSCWQLQLATSALHRNKTVGLRWPSNVRLKTWLNRLRFLWVSVNFYKLQLLHLQIYWFGEFWWWRRSKACWPILSSRLQLLRHSSLLLRRLGEALRPGRARCIWVAVGQIAVTDHGSMAGNGKELNWRIRQEPIARPNTMPYLAIGQLWALHFSIAQSTK